MRIHRIHYREHVFGFERFPGSALEGRLLLDGQRELLTRLLEAEDECWYLDEDGERLPAAQLFERSPWSYPGPKGPVKLLCRLLNLRDGQVLFSTPDSYLEGGLYDWMRDEGKRDRV